MINKVCVFLIHIQKNIEISRTYEYNCNKKLKVSIQKLFKNYSVNSLEVHMQLDLFAQIDILFITALKNYSQQEKNISALNTRNGAIAPHGGC